MEVEVEEEEEEEEVVVVVEAASATAFEMSSASGSNSSFCSRSFVSVRRFSDLTRDECLLSSALWRSSPLGAGPMTEASVSMTAMRE